MDKSFTAFGTFRTLSGGHKGLKFHSQTQSVDHLAFGRTGMDADAMKICNCLGSVEIFIFQFSAFAAVHGIGKVGAKFFYIKMIRTLADLFVRSKPYPDRSVGNFRMSQKILGSGKDLCDPGLVISSQKGSAVGDDEILPLILSQIGKITGTHNDIFFFI